MKGGRTTKNITLDDRRLIEKAIYTKQMSIKEIAEMLNRSYSCIYKEIKKGLTEKIDCVTYDKIYVYTADMGEKNHKIAMKKCGSKEKIIIPIQKEFLIKKIKEDNYSPYASLQKAKETFKKCNLICYNTIYRRIKKGRFSDITMEMLPYGKLNKNEIKKERKIAPSGLSIEYRPEEVRYRHTFGNWEIDSVMGKQDVSQNNMVTMIERKTRNMLIFKVKNHKCEEVVNIIDYLEKIFKDKFPLIFKSITCDNGTEFSFADKLETSKLYKNKKRTSFYYCHPNSPQERGSNEVCHRFIRRYIPSGTDFDDKDNVYFLKLQNYINEYPRKILNGKSSIELFKQELKELNISNRYIKILKEHI